MPCTTKTRQFFPLMLLVSLMSACASQKLTVETDIPAQVTLVNWGKLTKDGESLGKTPVTLDLAKLKGKVLRVDAPGKIPYYWVYSSTIGESVTASLKMNEVPKELNDRTNNVQTDQNKVHRLLVSAYKALFEKDTALAKSLAEKAITLAPLTAMPHIIKGLAEMEGGNKEAARIAFASAKSLDPDDAEITALQKLVE